MKYRKSERLGPWLVVFLLAAVPLGCSSEPFRYVPVSGDIKYEDGTTIPGTGLQLIFYPQVSAIDEKTHPKQGRSIVEADGSFAGVTSHKYNDGLIRGQHKVVVVPSAGADAQIAPEYRDVATTPLVVDTADPDSFRLRLKKP
jgi:hypothetical protein